MALGALASAPAAARAPRRRSWIVLALLAPGLAYLLLFFLAPLLQLAVTSLQAPAPGGGIGDYVPARQIGNYATAIAAFWPHILRSFGYALAATLLAFLISYPLAYAIGVRARPAPTLQAVLLILVIAPFFISFLLRTLAWKQLLPSAFIGSGGSVIFGLTAAIIPFMCLPITASLGQLDTRFLEAGADLYAPPLTVFRRITLPLSLPGVVSGTLLSFIPLSGDFVNASSEFLGSTNTRMIGNVIESSFLQTQNYPLAAALSILLMGLVLLIVATSVRSSGTDDLL